MRILAIILLVVQAGTSAAVAQGRASPGERLAASQSRIAGDFARNYLRIWSAPNPVTLRASPTFYGPVVRFHGRALSRAALIGEKRRFVQRWPVRHYRHRSNTVRVGCDIHDICKVRSLFDFSAANPRRSAYSRGTGSLELGVSLKGARPVIVSEASRVIRRDRRS